MTKTCWMSIAITLLCAVPIAAQESETRHDTGTIADDNHSIAPGDYWLGLWCSPIPPPLRLQLNLPEKQGVLVLGVAPDSPASRAGLLPHDVLLRVGDKPLTDPSDLIQAIEAAKEGKLKIELIRGGKAKTLEAAPAKRPEEVGPYTSAAPSNRDWEMMGKWFQERLPDGEVDGRQPHMQYRFFHPGAIVPGSILAPAPLPSNMSITISKEGDRPAKITVKRGDEKWELTEKDIDKLPDDVRPHVERMLGRGALGIVSGLPAFNFVPEMALPMLGPNTWESRIEKRLDEMNQRMNRMLQVLERSMGDHNHRSTQEKTTEK